MGLMLPRFLIISTRQGRPRNPLSFKERARVRMGSTDTMTHPILARPLMSPRFSSFPLLPNPLPRGEREEKPVETSGDGVRDSCSPQHIYLVPSMKPTSAGIVCSGASSINQCPDSLDARFWWKM
jgi:hypothetical protein